MLWRVIGSLFVGLWMWNAIGMFPCHQVSFSGGGGRVVHYTCWQLPSGVDPSAAGNQGIPGPLIGTLILVVGGLLLYAWWVRPFLAVRKMEAGDARLEQLRKLGIDVDEP